jgi:flagellar P-ring protein precursor FlgI
MRLLAFFFLTTLLAPAATRLKELVSIEGVRDNQLIGYGLVVGLNGTGDRRQTFFSAQSLTNLLNQMGVQVSPTALRLNNIAAVMVTANLPAFARPGSRIDVTAAAIGDAQNLQGGLLVLTSLRGIDGQIYAVAQGPLVTGGFVARGGANNQQTVNHPTVGRVPDGAIIERAAPVVALDEGLRLQLRQADFTTAARIAEAVNRKFGAEKPVATAENSGAIAISLPPSYAGRSTEFIAEVERLTVDADRLAKIVVNERTGTIVMGKDVKISAVAVMHGNLTVEVSTAYDVSQPLPFSQGETVVTPRVEVGVKQDPAQNVVLKEGASVEELVRALGAIGVTPRDVIAILQNIKAAGALEAELEIL